MAGKSKWVVVGGAAAFAVTPLVAFAGSSLAVPDIPGTGVVVQTSGSHDGPGPTASSTADQGTTNGARKDGAGKDGAGTAQHTADSNSTRSGSAKKHQQTKKDNSTSSRSDSGPGSGSGADRSGGGHVHQSTGTETVSPVSPDSPDRVGDADEDRQADSPVSAASADSPD
jgi:hypothetical protein